jgi:serine/threonine protein kinase
MEYCALGDIDQCFDELVSEQVARTIAGQLLEGLAVLHRLGITHRDIKPQAQR